MELTKHVVGVDFDDTLMDYSKDLLRELNRRFSKAHVIEEMIHFDFEKFFGCEAEEMRQIIDEFYNSELHDEILPLPGAFEVIKKLQSTHIFDLVTARPDHARPKVETLLFRHFPEVLRNRYFTGFYFVDPTLKISKGEICKKIGAKVLIDDGLHNAIEAAATNLPVYLLNKPWNQGEIPPLVTRVHDWDELGELLSKFPPPQE